METTSSYRFRKTASRLFSLICIVVFFYAWAGMAHAASLYFSPTTGNYGVGETISVGVYSQSQDQSMNAVSGGITFSPNLLQVVSISKAGSIVSLWAQEPTYSNAVGTVSFEGLIPNPGYQGGSGKIVTVTFRVKAVGSAGLTFASGSVLANDGNGTDILKSRGSALFTLQEGAGVVEEEEPVISDDDVTKPTLSVTKLPSKDETDPKARFSITASDRGSGISHFEIKIDGGEAIRLDRVENDFFETSALSPSKHTLLVKVFDKADNTRSDSVDFTINPLEAPTLVEYPDILKKGDLFVVRGTTKYPEATVTIITNRTGDEAVGHNVTADTSGNFTFISDKDFSGGVYEMSAIVTDSRGAKSLPSRSVHFAIVPSQLLAFGNKAVSILSVAIPLLGLIALLAFMLWFFWHKYKTVHKKLNVSTHKAGDFVHKTFDLLREDINTHVNAMVEAGQRRELTEEEKSFLKQFKKDSKEAENLLEDQIESIRKSI
jgi:hypothetical protein